MNTERGSKDGCTQKHTSYCGISVSDASLWWTARDEHREEDQTFGIPFTKQEDWSVDRSTACDGGETRGGHGEARPVRVAVHIQLVFVKEGQS